jgi:hypothetical protein
LFQQSLKNKKYFNLYPFRAALVAASAQKNKKQNKKIKNKKIIAGSQRNITNI